MTIPYRIGHGFDVHRFDANANEQASITLCGCIVPCERKLLAHSDGDVALHALCDALLGAVAAGDIGRHFPDSDQQYSNIDSRILLTRVIEIVTGKGYAVGNADITIIAQVPRLSPHVEQMQSVVSGLLSVEKDAVNIKATTTEKLGYVGREEGIAVHAVVILYKNS